MIQLPDDNQQLLKSKHISWHKSNKRWIALVLACMIDFGNSYTQDFPAVLQNQIEQQFDIGSLKYNLLFTVYSTPNIILPLFGGFFIDLIGIRKGLIIFPLFLIAGQGLCTLGSLYNSYTLLIIGRVIYGLGGENNIVTQSTLVSKWFRGKEIAFALGICITLYNTGGILNSIISPKLYNIDQTITLSLFTSLSILIFCWFCSCLLAYMDWKSDSRDEAYKLILIEEQGEQAEEEEETVSLRDISSFKVHYWLVALILMLSMTTLYGFSWNSIELFKTMFSLNDDEAQFAYSIPFFMGAVFAPFAGMVVDKIGQRPLLIIITNVFLTSINLWYFLIPNCQFACFSRPLVGQILIGICSIIMESSIVPTIPLCVKPHTVGTAFGIAITMYNIGFTTVPLIVGHITESSTIESYRHMILFLLILSLVSLTLSILLKLYDKIKLKDKLSKIVSNVDITQVQPSDFSETTPEQINDKTDVSDLSGINPTSIM